MRAVALLTIPLLALGPALATEENTGPNANVAAEIVGTLRLQTKSDQRYRGVEEWRIFVHGDGSRTMMLSKDFVAANALQIMTVHVAADFRPVDAYATYWSKEGYRGAIHVSVDGNTLRAASAGPGGEHHEQLAVPHEIAIVTHGESMNGWYLWQGERDANGEHQATYFNLNPSPDGRALVRGRLHPATFRFLGTDTVTVPAGTFETEHYLLSNIEMWVSGEHRLLVKQAITDEDKEYVLTHLETRAAP